MKWLALLGVLLAGLGWLYLRPLFDTHPEQDACTFGTVTNARYRELLAQAERRQKTTWPGLSGTNEEMSRNLTQRVQDLQQGMTSLEESLAAMHAVARALGAEYRLANRDEVNTYEDPHGRFPLQIVNFRYLLDVHRISGFYPLRRLANVFFVFHVHARPGGTALVGRRTNTFRASILWPNVFDPAPIPPPSRHHPACPPVPTSEWQRAYDAWLQTQPGEPP